MPFSSLWKCAEAPDFFKSTILTPTFSSKAEVKVTGSATGAGAAAGHGQHPSSGAGRQRQLRAPPASPGTAPHPSPAELHPGPGTAPLAELNLYRAQGQQKGWLSSPCFCNYICESSRDTWERRLGNANARKENHHLSRMLWGLFLSMRAVRL